MNAFEINESGHSFKFKCNKLGCKETCVIPYSDKTKDATMSNAYRHMKSCLLGVKRSGKEKSEEKSFSKSMCFKNSASNFFTPKKPFLTSTPSSSSTSTDLTLTDRRFSPQHEDDMDFSTASTKNITPASPTPPKNLKQPAGRHEAADSSGL